MKNIKTYEQLASDQSTGDRFLEAIRSNNYFACQEILKSGFDPNDWIDPISNRTLLHFAVDYDPRIVEELLDHGAEVDVEDDELCTPLHLAASHLRFDAILMLIYYGSNVNAVDDIGSTPLADCVKYAEWKFPTRMHRDKAKEIDELVDRCVRVFLKEGAKTDVELTEFRKKFTPLDVAIQRNLKQTAKTLIENGADFERTFPDFEQALEFFSPDTKWLWKYAYPDEDERYVIKKQRKTKGLFGL
jgi:ankyrin repeat protein